MNEQTLTFLIIVEHEHEGGVCIAYRAEGSQNTTGNKVESHERSHVNPILAQFSKHDVKSRKTVAH